MMAEFVVNFLIRATVILGAAWFVTALLSRASADLRHKIWLAAMIGATLAAMPIPVPEPLRIEVESRGAMAVAAAPGLQHSENLWLSLYSIVAALLLARLLGGLAFLARWTRQASMRDGSLFSASVPTAITWGPWKPVIVLPEYMRLWPAERRAMVLLHERAHIGRHDWLWQTFAELATAAFWFHPLMWIAAAHLRREAERAADDIVLQTGASPSEYAMSLMEAARRLHGSLPRAALAMAAERGLPSRIHAILDSSQTRRVAGLRSRVAIVAATAGFFVILAACQSVRVYRVAELTTPPRVVSKVEPQYTDDARTRKIAGTVGLHLVIDSQGHAENFHVAQSLDKGLDANAIAAVRQWQFDPGTKDGKPVRTAAVIEVNYHLQ